MYSIMLIHIYQHPSIQVVVDDKLAFRARGVKVTCHGSNSAPQPQPQVTHTHTHTHIHAAHG